MKIGTQFWEWVDGRAVVRRIVLFVTLWLTWKSFAWASSFATTTVLGGADAGLVIAAVTGPVAALQAFTFKWYGESRTSNEPA
jgi:hypothetical protein